MKVTYNNFRSLGKVSRGSKLPNSELYLTLSGVTHYAVVDKTTLTRRLFRPNLVATETIEVYKVGYRDWVAKDCSIEVSYIDIYNLHEAYEVYHGSVEAVGLDQIKENYEKVIQEA